MTTPTTTSTTRRQRFDHAAADLGHSFEGEIRIGGDYRPVIVHGGQAHVSGQIPRVGDQVMVTGRAGADASLAQAQHAARICAMRALRLLEQSLGSLDAVQQVLQVTVYVQAAEDFTLLSEVADAASGLLQTVLGPAGVHARTSVGVYRLPKNATVEVSLVAATA
ncbi:RidA family protein [Xylophilus sp. GW821-FHT01B05]